MLYLLDGTFTSRLHFRLIQESDAPEWLPFFQNPETSIHWVEERQSPEMACEQWYEKQFWRYANDKGGMNALIDKRTNALVGHAGLLVQTVDEIEELEIGYSLLPQFWNQGLASEAAQHCRDVAFQHQWATSLISIISETNLPSQKVALKNGMKLDKHTHYKNNAVQIYRIRREAWATAGKIS